MRISLRNWLLIVGIVGATVGIMARLLLAEPETFFNLLRVAATTLPFLLSIGTIIWIGLRGASRGRGLVIWGCTLLLIPVLAFVGMGVFLPSGNPLRLLSAQRLIAKRLPGQVDEPWVWRELERRLSTGQLAKSEVDNAVAALTAYMKRTSPTGWNRPLSWQREFVQQALQNGMISEATHLDLCEAFFGPGPVAKIVTPALSEGDNRFKMHVDYGTPWSDNSGLGVKLVWDLKQLQLNGKQVTLREVDKHFGRQALATAEAVLPPGDNNLEVELECAFIDEGRLTGINLDTMTAAQWPRTRKRWISKVTVPLHVAPLAESENPE